MLVNEKGQWYSNEFNETVSVRVKATSESPLINPCFVIRNWSARSTAKVKVNGTELDNGEVLKQGIVRDTDRTRTLVVWIRMDGDKTHKFDFKQNNSE